MIELCSSVCVCTVGAGKTYTMLGTVENPGVMFLTMMDLYKKINEVREEKTCDVAVSYCEVRYVRVCVWGAVSYCEVRYVRVWGGGAVTNVCILNDI